MTSRYDAYLHLSVSQSIRQLPRRPRNQIIAFLTSLQENPFQDPDYRETASNGTPLEGKVIGQYAITYHVDHAAKQIRVTELESADS
jgi:mRNA-degrading endonuclease RelE of RelBE toxin-antitoxin system